MAMRRATTVMSSSGRAALVALLVVTSTGTIAAAAGPTLPLVEAARRQDATAVRTLLQQRGTDVDAADANGTTALHWATDNNDLATTQLLVRAGANVKAVNRYGVSPIHAAALNGNADMLELLLQAGADANAALPEGETTLMTAAGSGSAEAIKVLLAHGADVEARERWKQQTALMWAAHEGNTRAVELLLEAGAKVGARSMAGWTPLLFAVRQGHPDTIKALLAAGADLHETLPDGTGALVVAIQSLNFQIANVLLELGIDPNAAAQGWTALHQIAWARRPQHGWRNPNQTPRGELSSLDLARQLVKAGADINARQTKEPSGELEGRNNFNRYGATPFLLAAKNVDVPMMEALLQLGADPFLTTSDGTSPLMVAAGVGVYSQGENPGLPEESADAVKLLLDLGAPAAAVDRNGDTALHGPAWRGSNQAAQQLIDAGAKLDAKNRYGWTPLMVADGVYYNARIQMNKHTAKLLRDTMIERGLEVTLEEGTSTNVNAEQSGVLEGNAVIADQVDASNPSEVKQNLLELQMKHEREFRELLERQQGN